MKMYVDPASMGFFIQYWLIVDWINQRFIWQPGGSTINKGFVSQTYFSEVTFEKFDVALLLLYVTALRRNSQITVSRIIRV